MTKYKHTNIGGGIITIDSDDGIVGLRPGESVICSKRVPSSYILVEEIKEPVTDRKKVKE